MKTTFGVGEVLKKGFNLTKKHISFLAGSTFVYLVVYMLLTRVGRGPAGLLLGIAGFVTSIIFTAGMYKIALLIEQGGNPVKEDFMIDWNTFWSFLITMILVGIITFVGVILFVIPGIIAAIRLSLGYMIVIDKKMSGWDAVKESWNMTRGYSWSILGFIVCSVILAVIASIPFGLGLIVVIPFLMISQAVIYRTILGNGSEVVVEPVRQSEPQSEAPATLASEEPEASREASGGASPVIE